MNDVLFKDNIIKYYNQEAELRNSKSIKPDWKIKVRENFCDIVISENKKTLLELGAGAGYDSQFFMNSGLNVTAVDISREMVNKCKEKGIQAYELDYYNLTSLNKRFDCIYAINTLLHVPKKDLSKVLHEINLVLNKDGLFYMGLYAGDDKENELIKSEILDVPRFFVFYSADFLKLTLKDYFDIISFETIDVGKKIEIGLFHSIILRKKGI